MSKKLDISKQILMIRKTSLAIYVALVAAAFGLMGSAGQQVRWFYQTNDRLADGAGTVFASGSHLVMDVQYRFVLVAVLVLAVAFTAAKLNVRNKKSLDNFAKKFIDSRWLFIGLTAAAMIELVGMVAGVQDLVVLKVMGLSVLVAALLSGLADRENKAEKKPVWRTFIVAVVAGTMPWLMVLGGFVATAIYGGVRMPWYAYALAGVTLTGFSAIAVNQLLNIKRHKLWKDEAFVERNYLFVGLGLKVAFAAVLIATFKR